MERAVGKKSFTYGECLQPGLHTVTKEAPFLRWELQMCDREGSVFLENSSPFHPDRCHKGLLGYSQGLYWRSSIIDTNVEYV